MLNSLVKVVAKPLPRIVSPEARAVVDYIVVGSFLAAAGWFWQRNKRAALAAIVCGGADLAVSLLTDYPGGTRKLISFRARREIDLGLAAMTATMPEYLAFKDKAEKKFFLAQGAVLIAISELTRFPDRPQRAEKGAKPTRAA
jgi:hypothetical protein